MKTLTTKWFTDEQGPKLFYSDSKRVQIHECSLSTLKEFSKELEDDFNYGGVYLLLGSDEEGADQVYIGETDSLKTRIFQHKGKESKQFAERIVLISSKDSMYPYSKTELHFLEKQLIRKFKNSEYIINNNNSGQGNDPIKIEQIGLNEELTLIYTGLESMGISLDKDSVVELNPSMYISDRKSLKVFAKIPNSEQIVKGIFNPDNTITILGGQSFSNHSRNGEKNETRVKKSILNSSDDTSIAIKENFPKYEIKYLKDVTYRSPSAAGYLILGGHANGWHLWKDEKTQEKIDVYRNK